VRDSLSIKDLLFLGHDIGTRKTPFPPGRSRFFPYLFSASPRCSPARSGIKVFFSPSHHGREPLLFLGGLRNSHLPFLPCQPRETGNSGRSPPPSFSSCWRRFPPRSSPGTSRSFCFFLPRVSCSTKAAESSTAAMSSLFLCRDLSLASRGRLLCQTTRRSRRGRISPRGKLFPCLPLERRCGTDFLLLHMGTSPFFPPFPWKKIPLLV